MLEFFQKITSAINQNLKGTENKKVLITSKLKKVFQIYRNIFSNTNLI